MQSPEKSPLTGRLVDENGEGLTPSHARKGERKYRYYVSRSFPAQGLAPSRLGWRLPARELEDQVAAAAGELLGDESALLEAAQKTDIDSSQVDRVLHAARTWRHRLQSEAEQTSAIGALVDRVELKCDGIRVSIKLPIGGTDKSEPEDQIAIARSFPMQLRRRGVELRLIVGDHNRSAAIVDLPLVKAVARAHRWFDEISTGRARSLAAIAAREGPAVRYVGRLIRLAFLAPEIVESMWRAGSRPLLPLKHSPGTSSFRSHGARREPL
jgi:site-specific DNA recombinase